MTGPSTENIEAKRYRYLRDHPDIRVIQNTENQFYQVEQLKTINTTLAVYAWVTILDKNGYASFDNAVDAAMAAEGRTPP